MNMLVRAGNDRWLTPVYVRIGFGIPEAIRQPRDALSFMLFRWPPRRGDAFHRAKYACSMAVAGTQSWESAREAFIRACIEAQVLD